MADMTLDEAMSLADQDSPLPHLAGKALKVLRKHYLSLLHVGTMVPPACSRSGCNLLGWMPCADRLCQKNATAKDCYE